MSFASIEFFVFLAVVYALYLLLRHRWQNAMLLGASYVFYGAWDWRFLSLILASTVVDYVVGLKLASTDDARRRKLLLLASLITNLGLLGVFKYYNFFADSAERLAEQLGWTLHWTTTAIVLPVGISFYTFQTLSYSIDVYRGRIEPTRRLIDFALFVAFFPQLVAGPIERAVNLLPQIMHPRRISGDQITRGAFLVLLGLVKKIAIADGVARSVDAIFNTAAPVSAADITFATWLFAAQIYCDFSGYSDIARGVAKMLGIELMTNFNMPYVSTNPSEFWRRWHISLSTWLRDYLYIPLGGSKQSEGRTYRNLMITMVLGGLWHGAAWNFVLWGVFQGAILCVHRVFAQRHPGVPGRPRTFGALLRWALLAMIFFQITCYGWLLFRATSLGQIIDFTHVLCSGWGSIDLHLPRPPLASLLGLITLIGLEAWQYAAGSHRAYQAAPAPVRGALYALLVLILLMGLNNEPTQFIYFQF